MIDIQDKNVFLSGPMTGCEFNNILAFLDAHMLLNEMGANRVYDPAYEWYTEVSANLKQQDHSYYMRRCVMELTCSDYNSDFKKPHYDLLVSLPGWQSSEGATLEREVAIVCGIEVCDLHQVVGDDE